MTAQAIRARQAARIAADFFNEPYVVGAHWFIYGGYDSPKREANRSLVRSDGRPWEELVGALREANGKMEAAVGGSVGQ